MSTPNPALVAAAPELIAALQALQQFETDMGPNPLQWVANYPGAKLKLLGTLALQLPAIANAEGGVLQGLIAKQAGAWIAQLQSISAKPAGS